MFLHLVKVEWAKIVLARSSWILVGFVIVGLSLMAFFEGVGVAQIGLDATPDTSPFLVEPLPPVEYIGCDVLPTGQALLIVIGALWGVSEFHRHQLRTTLLTSSSRSTVFGAKMLVTVASMPLLSLVGAWATFASIQLGLGDLGMNPFTLSGVTWRFIGGAVLSWTSLGLTAYALAFVCRMSLVPIILFVPLSLFLGETLARLVHVTAYLPPAAGNALYVEPTHTTDFLLPGPAVWVTVGWALASVAVFGVTLRLRDVGAR